MQDKANKLIASMLETMKNVVSDPAEFFRQMPTSGGFTEPLIFVIAMGIISGIIQALLGIVGFGYAGSSGAALLSIVFIPLAALIFGFVGAAFLFIIWKIMGSQHSYETAYRCGAYTGAIVPFTTLLAAIPYLGTILGVLWMTYILVLASQEVHHLKAKTAWIVFGILGALSAFSSIGSQHAARQAAQEIENMGTRMEKLGEMSPEEAGRKVGEFLKGLEKGIDK